MSRESRFNWQAVRNRLNGQSFAAEVFHDLEEGLDDQDDVNAGRRKSKEEEKLPPKKLKAKPVKRDYRRQLARGFTQI